MAKQQRITDNEYSEAEAAKALESMEREQRGITDTPPEPEKKEFIPMEGKEEELMPVKETDDDGFTEVSNRNFYFKSIAKVGDFFEGFFVGDLEDIAPDSGLTGLCFKNNKEGEFVVPRNHHLVKLIGIEKNNGVDFLKTYYRFILSEIKQIDKNATYKVFRIFKKSI